MSTLGTAVQNRVSTARLIQLTNLNSDAATTVDTATLELAVTDMESEFQTIAMEELDDTDARHVALGIAGVIAFLVNWKGQDADEKGMKAWRSRVADYAKTASRQRVSPLSSRTLGPSPDTDGSGRARRPEFDRSRFAEQHLEPPPADDTGP